MFLFQTGIYLAGGCLSSTELTTRQKWNIFAAETNYRLVYIKIKQTEKKMVNIKIDSHMGRCSVHLDTNMTKSKNSEICLSYAKWISTYTLATIKETTVSFQESCRVGSDLQQTDVLWILSEREWQQYFNVITWSMAKQGSCGCWTPKFLLSVNTAYWLFF